MLGGVERRQLEVAVVESAPSPVEVEISVLVVAVAHKGVTGALVVASHVHRAVVGKFVVNEVVPTFNRIEFAQGEFHAFVVAEIVGKRLLHLQRGSSRGGAVAQVGGSAAVKEQLRHGVALRFGGTRAVYVEHVVPIVGGGAEISRHFG